ncbi:hypothetical protein Tco_0931706, partial [Tanacetum coccineum]
MQDLYDRMGHMEIRQKAIERMEYRQSYHWDRYQGVFEHMAGVYSVSLQSPNMISIISSIHLHQHSISHSSSNIIRMMSSVEMTR